MMLALLILTVSALLRPTFGYTKDEGCFVKDKLHFDDFPTRSVKFTAFTPPSGIVFKARMKCDKGDYAADSLSVSKNEVTMMRYGDSLTPNKKCWPGLTTEAGWNDFDLKFGDAYEIIDGQGQSLISERIKPKCLVKEIEILNGSFITQCSEGMAKWEVHNGQCALVPLFLSDKGENLLNLTLSSRDKVRPVFHFGEQKVELGMKNGTFEVSENGTVIPKSSQSVLLLFDKNGSSISCTIKTGEQVLTKVDLDNEPRHVKVCPVENTTFLLMLTMKTTTDDNDEEQTSDFHLLGLSVFLVLNTLIAILFIFLYCLPKRQNNLLVGIMQIHPSPSSSAVPDPLPLTSTPLEDFSTPAQVSNASEEGVYCEMTLLPSMPPPPLSFDTECETINDTYISADLY